MSASQAYEFLRYERQGALAILSLDRPAKLNAINPGMIDDLNHALDIAEADEQVRVIVLRGEGKAFSAGFDLATENDGAEDNNDFWRKELRKDFDIIMRFWHSPKPSIAAVRGYCLGSAMEMAVACDITIATEDSRFGAPEVKFGSGIVALILPWVIGVKAAKELLLTGDDKLGAERALGLGLVNRVVPETELMPVCRQLAHEIGQGQPATTGAIKSLMTAMTVLASALGPVSVGLMLDAGMTMNQVCSTLAIACLAFTLPLQNPDQVGIGHWG